MTAALITIGSVQGIILLVQGVLLTLLLRTMGRVDAVGDGVGDLRVDVAKMAQRLDDHVVDPGAHAAV